MGIEPTSSAWKAEVLPLNYTRTSLALVVNPFALQILGRKHSFSSVITYAIFVENCPSVAIAGLRALFTSWWRG